MVKATPSATLIVAQSKVWLELLTIFFDKANAPVSTKSSIEVSGGMVESQYLVGSVVSSAIAINRSSTCGSDRSKFLEAERRRTGPKRGLRSTLFLRAICLPSDLTGTGFLSGLRRNKDGGWRLPLHGLAGNGSTGCQPLSSARNPTT